MKILDNIFSFLWEQQWAALLLSWVIILLIAFMSLAFAAEITVTPGDPAIVSVNGGFKFEDAQKFVDLTRDIPKAKIVLSSAGGNLFAGLSIGELIHHKGYSTDAKGGCASTCALSWLAGNPRDIEEDSSVIFHAAFNGDLTHASGKANILVGYYFSQIGLPIAEVVNLIGHNPDEYFEMKMLGGKVQLDHYLEK